jgi:hypothetical protein
MTDANSAMAFFYAPLNSWVTLFQLQLIPHQQRTSPDTCENNFCHVEFPLTFQTEACRTCFVIKVSRRAN